MAVVSNKPYFAIDDVEIPVYPTSVVPSHNLVTRSMNTSQGEFVDIVVNSKLKVNWVFDFVSEKDLKVLWEDMIYNKILARKSRTFKINTSFPGLGFISGNFYLGTPTSFTSKDFYGPRGKVNIWQCELHWIETDGIVITPNGSVKDVITVNGVSMPMEEGGLVLPTKTLKI